MTFLGQLEKLDWILNIELDIRYLLFSITEYGYGFNIK